MEKIKVYLQTFFIFFFPMTILFAIILAFPMFSLYSGDFGRSLAPLPNGLILSFIPLFLAPVLFMSSLFSLIIGTLHILSIHQVLKASRDSYSNIYGTKQDKTISLSISKEQAFSNCLEIINSQAGFKVKEQNVELGHIKCRSGSSWKSFGEEIMIKIEESENNSLFNIQSKPALITTIADYGKNLSNVILIEEELRIRVH